MLFAVKRFGVNLQFVWWKKASQKNFTLVDKEKNW